MPDLEAAGRLFKARFGRDPEILAWGPGRINVIGEHTDYVGGLAMPAAIDRRVVAAFARRADSEVRVRSESFQGEHAERLPVSGASCEGASWRSFVHGAIAVFQEGRDLAAGFDALVTGNVPLGSGLSSSAAIEVALLNGLRALYPDRPLTDLQLILLGQRVEHEHLGLHSGLLDQYASQFSQEGSLLVVDFRDLCHHHVPAQLDGHVWVVLDTGVRRELAGSAYRQRVLEVGEGLSWMKDRFPAIGHWRDITPEHLAEAPDAVWKDRIRHTIDENARVLATEQALRAGDLAQVGRLLVGSHESLRDLYAVSCRELDVLVEASLGWDGCLGARMVGGGFGGCVLALVRGDGEGFGERVAAQYRECCGMEAQSWRFRSVGGGGAIPWALTG